MRNAALFGMFVAAVSLGGGGCTKRPVPEKGTGTIDGGGAGGAGGAGGQGTGTGGAGGSSTAACAASDPRLVLADQRIMRLTADEVVNTVRFLIDDTEATALVKGGFIDAGNDSRRRFPPFEADNIDDVRFPGLDNVANHVASYVQDNFARVTGCSNASDACATAYLEKLAARAYRRQLTPEESARFTAFYAKLRSPQTVRGYLVTFSIQEATSYAVYALLSSPQMLWRWEIGDPSMAATAPAGIPLTEQELASQLAFFLTDQPPDDTLRMAADAGTLRANLGAQVDRLLALPSARNWLRAVIETYLRLNQVPDVSVDPNDFPIFTPALASDMEVEARMFLDNTLWNENLTDLLQSHTAFLNTTLATQIYGVTAPAGATATNFVRTTLPADQRSGVLTNAGLLTSRPLAPSDSLLLNRGLYIASTLLCASLPSETQPRPFDSMFNDKTGQEQVADRGPDTACYSCHVQFDPYGLAMENYDGVGRFRTVDDQGRPIDAHTTLPGLMGGGVKNGVELAARLAASPAFTNCMARTVLQYAMLDPATTVEAPLSAQQPGCATADVVQRYQSAGGKTFTDLVRATAAAPAFGLRKAAP